MYEHVLVIRIGIRVCTSRCRERMLFGIISPRYLFLLIITRGSSRFETALFDVRVFNPFAESNRACPSVSSCYRRHEREKRRMYDQRIRQVDGASFCPLVFAATGGAAPAATVFLKRLACKLAEHRDLPYSLVINWLRCRVCFALTRASIMCIRGSRSRMHQPVHCPLLDASEGRIPS